jgi:hypothetical protein
MPPPAARAALARAPRINNPPPHTHTRARTGLCDVDAEKKPYVASMGIYVIKKKVRGWGGGE